MKPASQTKLPRWIALLGATSAVIAPLTVSAGTYQWDGSDSTDWATSGNWVPAGSYNSQTIVAGPAPTGGTFAHRLNINNGTGNEAVYSVAQGTTVYSNGTGRGLVIGSGTPNSGTLRITGGSFSTEGTTGGDIIGNNAGNSATLIIDGGAYLASAIVAMGIGGGPTSTLTVNSGSATIPTLSLNNTTGTVNLNGGTLALNTITRTAGTNTLYFNGGTLKARVASTTFLANLDGTTAYVKSNGAVIDTSGDAGTGVAVTIAEPLLEDPSSTGGGLTKNGAGTLTLAAPTTISGDVIINAGGLGVKASAASSWFPANFTHSGDILNFDLGSYNPSNPVVIDVTALTVNSAVTVNVTGSNFQVGQIPLIQYATRTMTGTLTLNPATLPVGVEATLVDNGTGLIYLDVTQAATFYQWSGASATPGTGNWDTTSQNWNSFLNTYSTATPQVVQFPDITGGGTVTITAPFSPLLVTIANAGNNTYSFVGTGKITGTGGLTKSGTGVATFTVPNDYSGPTAVNEGALVKGAADDTTGTITVATNAAFGLSGNITEGAGQTLNVNGPGLLTARGAYAAVQRGALSSISGNNTWTGNITIASGSTNNRIGVQDGAQLTLSGNITEAVAGTTVIFRHGGTAGSNITISGTGNYWTGETQIFGGEGAVILGIDNALPVGSHLRVGTSNISGTGSVLDLNGCDQACAGLSRVAAGPAFITNNGADPSTLTVDAAIDFGWYGIIQNGTNVVNLAKTGVGKLTLGGVNAYTGTTTVTAGQLEIMADQLATGDILVNGGSLKLSSVKHLASGVNLSLVSGSFFYLDGSSQTLGKLEGSGTVDFTWTVAGIDTLTVGANDSTSTFDGVIQQSTVRTYALTKIGTGTFTMTGANTYTGNTTVEDGTLAVAQPNFADSSTVMIGSVAASPAVLYLPNAGTDIVAALVIDGVSQPGDGAVYDSLNSGGAISGNGKIQVGTVPASGFGPWITGTFANGTVPSGEQGPGDDPDKDSIDNLLEFVLNGDPTVADLGILPDLAVTATDFEFTYQRRDDSIAPETTQTFEWGTTLTAWPGSAIVPAANGTVGAATITVSAGTPDDGVTDTVKVSIPRTEAGSAGKLFGRLKVAP